MKKWTKLKPELEKKFPNGWWYYNDKNKYTRRIKILGSERYRIKKYLEKKYPGIVIWEDVNQFSSPWGVCFNLKH